MAKLLSRSELNINHTWDLTRLFKTQKDYEQALDQTQALVDNFKQKYETKLKDVKTIINSLADYKVLIQQLTYIGTYQSLALATDQTNQDNVIRSTKYGIFSAAVNKALTFYLSELKDLSLDLLNEVAQKSSEDQLFIEELIKQVQRKLTPEVELALAEFSSVLNAQYSTYNKVKLGDMDFGQFSVNNQTYVNSFSKFESEYQSEANIDVRRAAFESFYEKLGQYENGLAANYYNQILKEKAYANLYKFDSVIHYLLDDQEVEETMYNRQIDYLMDQLSTVFRKYAKLLKETHNIDKMTYADLQIALDPEFEPNISIEESKEYALKGLKLLGSDYTKMIEKSFNERWTDFPQNIGKSTGGFCSSPYQKGAFILLNWNNMMDEAFVLAHELGHAGHFYFAGLNQNILNMRPSMFFIEAPSTMNELIMADYLKTQSTEPRFKRWVLSAVVARTYYHNCVTHLLEAYFQREVYRKIDQKMPISAAILNDLMLQTIKKFWGDDIEIPAYAGRTWMRQPHYYMGLYPYTYSAGLTIATNAFSMIKGGSLSVNEWLDVLKAGGTKKPLELALMAKVDYTSDQPLKNMVEYVDSMVEEMIKLSKKD